jgi:hypothetical protein
VPSMAFAKSTQARLHHFPASRRESFTTLQTSLYAADRTSCSTPLRPRPLNRTRELHYRAPWRLPEPDSHRLATESLRSAYVITPP